MSAPLLVYGGTFDPVHAGHVAVARAAADVLGVERALLIPCGDPPHRQAPQAPGALRARMLRLAFAEDPRFVVDERELQRHGPSYTVDTLSELRHQYGPNLPLVLLLGVDAANGLPSWRDPRRLAELCHLFVVERPGVCLGDAVYALGWQATDDVDVLRISPAGALLHRPIAVSGASSTAIRTALARGVTPPELPPAVAAWLRDRPLYR